MAIFEYTGKNNFGQNIKGRLEAQSYGDVRLFLQHQGLRPIKLQKIKKSLFSLYIFDRLFFNEIDFWNKFKNYYSKTNDVAESFRLLGMNHGRFKNISLGIYSSLMSKQNLIQSLRLYYSYFSEVSLHVFKLIDKNNGDYKNISLELIDYLSIQEKIKLLKSISWNYMFVLALFSFGLIQPLFLGGDYGLISKTLISFNLILLLFLALRNLYTQDFISKLVPKNFYLENLIKLEILNNFTLLKYFEDESRFLHFMSENSTNEFIKSFYRECLKLKSIDLATKSFADIGDLNLSPMEAKKQLSETYQECGKSWVTTTLDKNLALTTKLILIVEIVLFISLGFVAYG